MAEVKSLGWLISRGMATAIKAAQTTNPLTRWFWGQPPTDGEYDISDEGLIRAYLASLWVYRCIDVRAKKLASIPLQVKTMDGQYVDRQGRPADSPISSRVHQHVLQKLIGDGTRQMWRSVEYDRCIFGRAYVAISNKGLTRLNPYTIEVEKDETGIQMFRQRLGGDVISEWKPKEMIYLYDYDPQDDLGSLSPLMFALRSISAEVSVGDFVTSFFANDATPAGLLTSDQAISEPDMEVTKKFWEKAFRGTKNKGKTAIVGGGLHYEKIASDPENMAIAELRLEIRREITAAFGVPMTIALADEAANFSTSKEQHMSFYSETIIPQLETVVDALNDQLVPIFDSQRNLKIVAELSGVEVLQEAKTEVSARLNTGFTAGTITINEVRDSEGNQPFEQDYIIVPNIGIIMVDDLPKVAKLNVQKLAAEAMPPTPPEQDMGFGGSPAPDQPEPPSPDTPDTQPDLSDTNLPDTSHNAPPEPKGLPDAPKAMFDTSPLSHRASGITFDSSEVRKDGDPATALLKPAYVTIPLEQSQELVDLQNRLKAELGGNDAGDWQSQSTLHLSLACVTDIDDDRLKAFAKDIQPRRLTLNIIGTNIFPDAGNGRVLHAVVEKTPELASYQRAVYDGIMAVGAQVSPYNVPEAFQPHITLCYLGPNATSPIEECDYSLTADAITISRDDYKTIVSKDTIIKHAPLATGGYVDGSGIAPLHRDYSIGEALSIKMKRQIALDDLTRWEKKVKSKGVAVKFNSLALPPSVKMFLKWDLENAGEDKDEIKAAFDRAVAVMKSTDPTPEEFDEFWKGLDETAVGLDEMLGDLIDTDVRKRLAERLDETADIGGITTKFFEEETEGMVAKLIGTDDEPGPLAKIFLAGSARGQELADKLKAKGQLTLAPEKKALDISQSWKLIHQQAMGFAKQYAYDLVKGMNATTQETFKDGMSAWVKQGGTLPTLIDFLMGRLKGLDIPAGWSDQKMAWATSRNRARLIAQTESTRAFTEGNISRWSQLGIKSIRWRTQNDRIVCPACKDLNNTIAVVGKGFAIPIKHQSQYGATVKRSPLHPGCRCFCSPVTTNPAKPLEKLDVTPKRVRKPKEGELVVGETRTE